MKLSSITFDRAPRIPGVRPGDLSTIECDNPTQNLRGWRALVRGSSLFLVSPPGWMQGRQPHEFDISGPCSVHEIPRVNCFLHWSGNMPDIEMLTKGRFDSPPFGPAVPPSTVVQTPLLSRLDKKEIGDM